MITPKGLKFIPVMKDEVVQEYADDKVTVREIKPIDPKTRLTKGGKE